MNNDKKPKIDESKLTSEQRDKLDQWKNDVKQLQTLEDIAAMAQDMLGIMDDNQKDPGRKTLIIDHVTGDDFVKILKKMQDSLEAFKGQDKEEMPDYATPVVAAVERLAKAISSVKPVKNEAPIVNVPAPNVTVKSVEVDVSPITKAINAIPKAFEKAVALIPTPEKPDNSELLAAWEGISEQLVSIENATRMKPIPGSMKVSNKDGSIIGGIQPIANFDYIDVQQTSSSVDTYVYKLGGAIGSVVRTIVVTYTSSAKTDIDTVSYS